jgi:hypothetical protein
MNKKISLGVGIVIILAGVLTFSYIFVTGVNDVAPEIKILSPGSEEIYLPEKGTYYIFYERKGYLDDRIYITNDIYGLECHLTSKSTGENVTLQVTPTIIKYRFNGREGEVLYKFEIPSSGHYILSSDSQRSSPIILSVGQVNLVEPLIESVLTLTVSLIVGIVLIFKGYRTLKR